MASPFSWPPLSLLVLVPFCLCSESFLIDLVWCLGFVVDTVRKSVFGDSLQTNDLAG